MSLTAVRSLRWPRWSPHRLPYRFWERAGGLAGRALPGRYAETVASPSSQNRQGYAAASPPGPLTPTRGPVSTLAPGDRSGERLADGPRDLDDNPDNGSGEDSGMAARSTSGLSAAVVSRPFWSRVSAKVIARRAGPRARSRSVTPTRRARAISSPPTTLPARSRTALAAPAGPQTRFAHQCIP